MIAEIKVFLIAMSPILELRGSIPMALGFYHMPVWSAFFISIFGNVVPIIFILLSLGPVSGFLSRRSNFFNKFFKWLFERTRKKHTKAFEQWRDLALTLFVAIPAPFTGAWTASLCAFVFGIPFKRAFISIACGVIIAGVIVTLTTLGIIKIII